MKKKTKKKNYETFAIIKMIITMIILIVVVLGIIAYVLNGNVKSNNKINVEVGEFPQLDIYKQEDALNTLEPTKVTVSNKTNTEAKYELYITVDKKSSIDYQYVRLSFDGTIYDLSTMHYYDDGNKYYFEVLNSTIPRFSSEEHDAIIWLDESYNGGRDNKNIYIGFDTII